MEIVLSSGPRAAIEAPSRLSALAEQIGREHVAATFATHAALGHARRAGALLIEAKRELHSHGRWLPWLSANVPVTARMAQLYMQLSRDWPQVVAAANAKGVSLLQLSISAALALLRENGDDEAADTLAPGGTDNDHEGMVDEDIRPERYTRSVVLYFDGPAYDEFMQQLRELKGILETTDVTNTVQAAVAYAHDSLVKKA
jgi:hypothetical protein